MRTRPAAKPKRLPRVLTADQFRAFYKAVDAAKDVQHALMLRLLFFTAVRVSELCRIEVADVDLEGCKVFISQGKGWKDRYVLFGKGFATALRTHIAAHPQNRWLFQTRRCGKFSTRRVEQIVKQYAEEAGIQATPHVFRHQCITFLTKTSGLADAELQLITGHARRDFVDLPAHRRGWAACRPLSAGDEGRGAVKPGCWRCRHQFGCIGGKRTLDLSGLSVTEQVPSGTRSFSQKEQPVSSRRRWTVQTAPTVTCGTDGTAIRSDRLSRLSRMTAR